jgi:hypothetical protein
VTVLFITYLSSLSGFLRLEQSLRRQAENSFEMTAKMALIDETDTVCSFADSELACGQKFLRFSHPGLNHILVSLLASRLFER